MDDKALKHSYDLFSKDGYNGTFEEYKELINSNEEAKKYSYDLFKNDGYNGGIEDFSTLIAVKPVKEEAVATETAPAAAVDQAVDTDSQLEDGSLDSQETSERDLIIFNIEETQKQIDNYIARGGEVNESDARVLQGYKDDLKKFDRGSDFSSRKYEELRDDEKIKLLEIASNEISSTKEEKGIKDYKVSEKEIEDKAADILREQMNPSLISDYSAKAVRGFANFLKGTTEFGDMVKLGLMEGALNIFDPEYKGSLKERQALRAASKATSGMMGLDLSEDVNNFTAKLDPYIREYENESMIDDIADGNYLMAGERAVGAAIESIPSIVAAATGYGGLTLLAGSSAGNKFEEEFKKDPEKGTALLVSNALLTGTVEAGFELVTRGVLKRAGILQSTGNSEAAKKLIEGGVTGLFKNLGINTVSEAGSEAATRATTLFIDNKMLGREFDLEADLKSIAEEALVGSVFGIGGSAAGGVINSSPAAKDAAENILMPSEIKKSVGNTAKQISELHKALETTEGESAEIIKNEIRDKSIEIYDIKKKNSLALESMTRPEIEQYAKNKSKIESIEKTINKGNKSKSVVDILENNLSEIKENNKTLYNESISRDVDRKFDADVENVSKSLKSIGQKVDGTFVFEADKEGSGSDKMKKFLIDNGIDKDYAEQNKDSYGTFITTPDGKEFLVINKDSAKRDAIVTTGQHEFLHKVLRAAVSKDSDLLTKAGKTLLEDIELTTADTAEGREFKRRVEQYRSDDKITEAKFYEEILPLFSEAISRKDINIDRNILKVN